VPTLVIVVYGETAPAGSKRIVPVGKKGGPTSYRSIDANPRTQPWKEKVAREAGLAMQDRPLLRGPLEVQFTFYRRRPKGHFGTRGLLPSAPAFPTVKPDALKLARGVEDALTGVCWNDDAQICRELLIKEYGEPERVCIVVRELAG
jgi:Holliday junction resolvase RusA-like endonuclease